MINQCTGSDQRHTGTLTAQDSQISEFPIRVGSFTLPLGSLQVEQSPLQAASMHDSVGSHIPQKIKEKILIILSSVCCLRIHPSVIEISCFTNIEREQRV